MGSGRTRINSLPGSIKKQGKGGVTPPISAMASSHIGSNDNYNSRNNNMNNLNNATSLLDIASPSTLKNNDNNNNNNNNNNNYNKQ